MFTSSQTTFDWWYFRIQADSTSTNKKAKLLEVHLRKEGMVDISLSIAHQSTDIVSGHWTWKNINTPSCFFFVLFSRSDPSLTSTSTSTSEEIRYLSIKTKKYIGASSLKKLTETDIKIPADEHGILHLAWCIQREIYLLPSS